jgi:hypothetical protein
MVHGQPAHKVVVGPLLQEHKGTELQYIFGSDSTHFYALRYPGRKKEGLILEKINADSLGLDAHTVLQFPANEKSRNAADPLLMYPLALKNRDYLLTTSDEVNGDAVYLDAWPLRSNLTLDAPTQLGVASKKVLNAGQVFLTYTDPARQHLLCLLPQEADPIRNFKFSLALYGSDMKPLGFKQLELPHAAAKLHIEGIHVHDSTAVYMLISTDARRTTERKDSQRSPREYALVRYNWADEVVQEKALSLGSRWLYEVGLTPNGNGSLLVAGYYSNIIELVMSGSFALEVDLASGAIVQQGMVPFERNYRSRFRPPGASPDKSDLAHYTMGHIFATPDGLAEIISEKQGVQTSTIFNPATGTYSIIKIYTFDQLLINRIDGAGRLVSTVQIPKFQSSPRNEGFYTSYSAISRKGNTYIFYNDHERNESIDVRNENNFRSLTAPAAAALFMAVVTPQGLEGRYVLSAEPAVKAVFSTAFTHPVPGGVVIAGFAGSRTQYIKVMLP